MRIELNEEGICMKRQQVVKVRDGIGHTVICTSGSVWVTQDGDQRDVVLRTGESFTLDREGPALVQAFEPGAIAIRQPAPKIRTSALPAFLRTGILGARFTRDGVHA